MSNDLRFFQEPSSKLYNTSTNHPLIPNANDYIIYKKYVSIHSEDRDVLNIQILINLKLKCLKILQIYIH